MTTYGLTLEGLVIKTLAVIREGYEARLKGKFGVSIDTSDRSVEGQVGGIVSEAAAMLWELGEAINNARSRDRATGAQLDDIGILTGTFRGVASYSAVTLTLTGIPTSPVPLGSLAEVEGTGRQFQTIEDKTITALAAWAGSTVYAIGDRRTNADNAYVVITAGTSASTGGPATLLADITDGTVHWRFMGVGVGAVDALARATETGPIIAVSGSINQIASHLGGWSSVINLLDARPGTNAMKDEEYRVLQELELAKQGTSPQDAIAADLFDVPGVVGVTVFVNFTDFTDADGVPPHSIEAMIDGGDDQAIWDQLLASVAGGIRTHGTEVGSSDDSSGAAQVMKFSRADLVPIYIVITLEKVPHDASDDASYPADGDDAVKLAIATFGNLQGNGRNAVAAALQSSVFGPTGVPGVTNVISTLIGIAPSPATSTPITITKRQRATYDTSRITVTSSDGDF